MKFFIFVLILAAFFQTTFVPLNLVLILIICRSYVVEERANYYLAFLAGIVLSLLTTQNIGFWPITFLIIVKLVHLIRRLPFTASALTIIPVAAVLISLVTYIESFITSSSFSYINPLFGTIISFPIFIAIKIWEERFVPNKAIKLKI